MTSRHACFLMTQILSGALKRNVQIPSHLCQLGLAAGVTASWPFADVSPFLVIKKCELSDTLVSCGMHLMYHMLFAPSA